MEKKIEKWGIYEESFKKNIDEEFKGNPFLDIELSATFIHEETKMNVRGFYDGDGIYKIRFMPEATGEWKYITQSNSEKLNGLSGSFTCIKPSKDNHGLVKVKDKFHFEYSDKTKYYPFGTTCYAWIHQSLELQEETLESLKNSPFNKIRMCVFPKYYLYNTKEPEMYPYEGTLEGGFDYARFNIDFFKHLEKRIKDLLDIGIECDLILFHPYDKWGFSNMGEENDYNYLRYIISRLSCFRNVWWSMANEYDVFIDEASGKRTKSDEYWDRLGETVYENDIYGHLNSIHNCLKFYDYSKEWISHCSMQRIDSFKTAENTDEWRQEYNKPIVIDECAYEGNIAYGWGNITGEEMTRRFWEGFIRGGYVGHGETYVNNDDILWWSHGGKLHGTSPKRIKFLRNIIESAPGTINPIEVPEGIFNPYWDVTCGKAADYDYYIFYFGFYQPSLREFNMDEDKKYKVDIIDTWSMTIKELDGDYSGKFTIDMPGKQYIAVRIRNIKF